MGREGCGGALRKVACLFDNFRSPLGSLAAGSFCEMEDVAGVHLAPIHQASTDNTLRFASHRIHRLVVCPEHVMTCAHPGLISGIAASASRRLTLPALLLPAVASSWPSLA
jgi:hypothetical protein